MRAASARRGSISMAYSPSGSKSNTARSFATSRSLSSGVRKVGVPPPQCIFETRRPPGNAAATRSASRIT
ncbi:hypothetical protein D3C83_124410 [compost metagenome]